MNGFIERPDAQYEPDRFMIVARIDSGQEAVRSKRAVFCWSFCVLEGSNRREPPYFGG